MTAIRCHWWSSSYGARQDSEKLGFDTPLRHGIFLGLLIVTYFIHCYTISKAERKVDVWANFSSSSPNKLNDYHRQIPRLLRCSFKDLFISRVSLTPLTLRIDIMDS